jgi:hypothetical protein
LIHNLSESLVPICTINEGKKGMLAHQYRRIIIAGLLVMVFGSSLSFSKPLDTLWQAFPTKLIFSETPEIGYKWKPGLRVRLGAAYFTMNDTARIIPFPVVDLYWNIANILAADLIYVGVPRITANRDTSTNDSTTLADNFKIISLKSRPWTFNFPYTRIGIAGGIKWYSAAAELKNTAKPEESYNKKDGALSIFAASSALLAGFNYFNLYSSLSFRSQNSRIYSTYYLVPGYRIYLGKRKMCSLGIEYFIMNPRQLPIKSIQYLSDADNLEFENLSQQAVTFLYYGFSFATRKIFADFNFGNHPSFFVSGKGPLFLSMGFGYNF